ncbi:MAG: UPF0158 family protein [Intrasporangium sp.]|uniref:UPF0158 family protein n=1 Tax=Intrasporangium sp. TaxID=1925024 RepID=UPI0026472791|nr:UPF0158 family protein [Intrasporangium sp.]MDN5794549.1 UPF0158 family protein [Intrasporangium sp.]
MDGDEVQQLRVTAHEGGDRFIGRLRRVGLSEHSLQLVGGALVREVGVGTAGAAALARECRRRLDARQWDGDEELSAALAGVLGDGPVPLLRPLPVDLEELAYVLESQPDYPAGRIDLSNGDVLPGSAFEYLVETGELPGEDTDDFDPDRWLYIDSLGSRSAYRDMEWFIDQQADEHLRDRLDRAISGRGAFRHFRDVLEQVGLLEQWHEIENDSQRGRARQWLADEGYAPAPQGPDPG